LFAQLFANDKITEANYFMNKILSNLLQLTKPSIMLLVLTAGATAIIMEGSMLSRPDKFAVFLLGLFLTGGCANALNQYFEREIDARMTRTCGRRPLPLKKISDKQALWFSILIGITGVMILGLAFNWLTAFLSVGTILFYGLFYTLWLKPNTPQNIVIGGIAGAMAPVGAWAAATGTMAVEPWLLFLIIFFWTPPHFWALALRFKDDYKVAGLPMMPLAKGDEVTLSRIFVYTLILFGVSLLPLLVHFGWIYLVTVIYMGVKFIFKAYQAKKINKPEINWQLFKYSIAYLFAIFMALIADSLLVKLL
jgi:protoheme IX farnesyltransferase